MFKNRLALKVAKVESISNAQQARDGLVLSLQPSDCSHFIQSLFNVSSSFIWIAKSKSKPSQLASSSDANIATNETYQR
jgi:hypothetical protein